jgi:hypothetical protein
MSDPGDEFQERADGASQQLPGEKFVITRRGTGAVVFEAILSSEVSCETFGTKLGAATMLALKAGAYLADADLAGANLACADLTGAYLAGAKLAGANLAGAYLAGAYLACAKLAGANLAGAKLAGANLAGANLADADLAGANLADANLTGAYLACAKLAGANLAGAKLAGVKHIIAAGQPNGFWAFGYRERDTGGLRIKVGCHDKAIIDAREYWSDSHPRWTERQEIPAALDMIEAVARLRGWERPQ